MRHEPKQNVLCSQDGHAGAVIPSIGPNDQRILVTSPMGGEILNPRELVFNVTSSVVGELVDNSTHLYRLDLDWGSGTGNQSAIVDLRHGLTLALAAVSYRLNVDTRTIDTVGGALPVVGPNVRVTATIAYGPRPARSVGDVTLTEPRQNLAADATFAAPFQVPPLATHVSFFTAADPLFAQPLELSFARDTVGGFREVVAPARGEFTLIPNGAELVTGRDLTGLAQNNVGLVWAINL